MCVCGCFVCCASGAVGTHAACTNRPYNTQTIPPLSIALLAVCPYGGGISPNTKRCLARAWRHPNGVCMYLDDVVRSSSSSSFCVPHERWHHITQTRARCAVVPFVVGWVWSARGSMVGMDTNPVDGIPIPDPDPAACVPVLQVRRSRLAIYSVFRDRVIKSYPHAVCGALMCWLFGVHHKRRRQTTTTMMTIYIREVVRLPCEFGETMSQRVDPSCRALMIAKRVCFVCIWMLRACHMCV